ncbi:hypothetical protein [Legionella israelensis]|uniref:Uncharacterized protein n=1 Tax=Legionella israelensis TaxID=454 RepID=A0A0W0VIV0_9GAMM|nr:hypothetical protein [Legionella israelensis]KTD20044.1 hypothetical protein Lisr_1894 [Legionella israelensis]QBS11222.1 hypothetical protein E4T55_15025 [Legionella israelensis]SCY58015.1 hypothetical protein SAMN02746069_02935 [Legionella israelensis DSM 19235]STX61039.1 Uncharacterised protein [Legionella israelensis]
MGAETTERNFFWWFSHFRSGLNESKKITCSSMRPIIKKKSEKLKNGGITDPTQNDIKKARFSLPDAIHLLDGFDIKITG